MIVLYILGALVLLLAIVLLSPLKVEVSFSGDFWAKVKFFGFTLYPKNKKPKYKPKHKKSNTNKPKQKEKNLFEKLVEKRGFKDAIREIFAFLKDVILPFKKFLKALKFRKIKVDLVVAGSDACETAINYGTVCSVVYPVLSLFQTVANAKHKNIDVRSDFEGGKSSFGFSLELKISLLLFLIIGFKIFKEYNNFCVRNDL